jgi:hypothetical protein
MTTARVRLNPQGLARKDAPFMSSVIPDPGHVFVSCDLSSGEPTCTAHYSQDRNYYDATFGMVGKLPRYTPTDLLKIDNLYYTVMSVTPMGRQVTRDLFDAGYDGQSFAERWRVNGVYRSKPFQDYIKDQVKKEYAFHKMGTLGMGYGMGPTKFQQAAYDAGYIITKKEASEFFQSYWTLFARIRTFAKKCEKAVERKGYLVNDFGYRLIPDKGYKAFNYFIQSSVSGIMHVLCRLFFETAPYCKFLMIIHDEVIFSCPEGQVNKALQSMRQTEDHLNAMLKWRVRVRIGFTTGRNLYEAK